MLYSSSRLATPRDIGLGLPLSEELLGPEAPDGLARPDGVEDVLPLAEFLVELGDLERAGGDLIELLHVGAVGALIGAVEFGGAGREHGESLAPRILTAWASTPPGIGTSAWQRIPRNKRLRHPRSPQRWP